MKTPIYLDYQATTPVDKRVVDAMHPYWTEMFGNPHSASHAFGWRAEAGVDIAREQIADLLFAQPEDIIFMSGATESDNLIIKGVMERFKGVKDHLITVKTEHSAVIEAAKNAVEHVGGTLTLLDVDGNGLICLDALENAITDRTALVSVMAVNNEIGVIQPIEKIIEICHARGVLVHVDAAQAVGKISLDAHGLGVDFMSFTAHKFYGPKGIGGAYVKKGKQRFIIPQMHGGSQELGLRAGTVSPPLCVGMGMAAKLCQEDMIEEEKRLRALATHFFEGIKAVHPLVSINGSTAHRWAGNLNIAFPGLDGAVLTADLKNLAVSSSSACSSTDNKPSRVLLAMGMDEKLAQSSLRIGFGRMTTPEEVDFAIAEINRVVTDMGGLSLS